MRPSGARVAFPVIRLTWRDIESIAAELATIIRLDGLPDCIVGLQRGGLVPAVMLSHRLGVRVIRVLDVSLTIDDSVLSAKRRQPVFGPLPHLGGIGDCDVLVVDDVAGSGATLRATVSLLREYRPASIRTLVCALNTGRQHDTRLLVSGSVTYVGCTAAGWFIFPWECSESE